MGGYAWFGTAAATMAGHRGEVLAVVALPDGGLVSAGRDDTVRRWDPQVPEVRWVHRARWIVGLSIVDGAVAVTLDGDGVRLLDPGTGERIGTRPGTAEPRPRTAPTVFDGRPVTAHAGFEDLWLVDADGGRPLAAHHHADEVQGVCLAAGLVASACQDGTVRLWDPARRRAVRDLAAHRGWAWAVCSLPGRRLASVGDDLRLRIWDPRTGELLAEHADHDDEVTAVAAAGPVVVTAAYDGTIAARTVNPLWTARPGPEAVRAIVALHDGRTIATAGHDGLIRLWETETGRPVRVHEGHTGRVLGLCRTPRGLASAGGDGTVRLWDSGEVLRGHEGEVTGVATLADGTLVSVGEDATARFWGREPAAVQLPAAAKCLVPHGNEALVGLDDGGLVTVRK